MPGELNARTLSDVATAVWRLQNKITDGPALRHVRAVVDALTAAGVETRQYDRIAFDSGMRLRVLAFEPTPGLTGERIVETVRPSVHLHGTLIQLGEVIVGIPEPSPEEKGGDDGRNDD